MSRNEGGFPPDPRIPSEAALTQTYDVSRWTARRALADLEHAGLIETRHGKGRFVA